MIPVLRQHLLGAGQGEAAGHPVQDIAGLVTRVAALSVAVRQSFLNSAKCAKPLKATIFRPLWSVTTDDIRFLDPDPRRPNGV